MSAHSHGLATGIATTVDGLISKAFHQMVVDHSHGLHKRVADRGPDEIKSASFQVFAHRVRLRGPRRNLPPRLSRIYPRLAACEAPNVAVETAKLLGHAKEGFRIRD